MRIGKTLYDMADGAEALMVGGDTDRLYVEKEEGEIISLFLRENGQDVPMEGMVVTFKESFESPSRYYRARVKRDENGIQVFEPIEPFGESDADMMNWEVFEVGKFTVCFVCASCSGPLVESKLAGEASIEEVLKENFPCGMEGWKEWKSATSDVLEKVAGRVWFDENGQQLMILPGYYPEMEAFQLLQKAA